MKPGKSIRLLVIDDHRVLRDALRVLLEKDGGIEMAGEAEEALEGVEQAVRIRPDVILLDIGMRGLSGIQAAHRLRKEAPASKVIILSKHDEEEYVLEAFGEAGAAGYVIKTDGSPELVSAIRAVAAGKRYISPAIAPIVLEKLRRNIQPPASANSGLTTREREILTLIAQGAAIKEIATKLGISPKTVQVHRSNLAGKLHLGSTAALVRYAIKHKLSELD
jgi:DNA-binding NarL/FixJ family response regulator